MHTDKMRYVERKGIYCPGCGFWNRPERMNCFNCEIPLPKKGLKTFLIRFGTTILACITVATLLISIYGFDVASDKILHEALTTLAPPSGYTIVRGLDGFPSDHIIISVDWHNSWKQKREIIRQPYLIMNNSSATYKFYFVGEFPQFSRRYFANEYNADLSRSGTFIIQPKSVSTHAIVFQIDNYWNNKSPNYKFRFVPGDTFRVCIGFEKWNGTKFEPIQVIPYFITPIRGYVGELSRDKGNAWDYYAFNSSTGILL